LASLPLALHKNPILARLSVSVSIVSKRLKTKVGFVLLALVPYRYRYTGTSLQRKVIYLNCQSVCRALAFRGRMLNPTGDTIACAL